ncbi:MAG: cadmium-translocating P-type ATPase [Candidatus Hydrogenedentes bacterium]|nr:cadmium-translocating P-type ATPase [Candidatus Hydrogenedentota bacterium]
MSKLVFKIAGMDCSEEVAALKRELRPLVDSEESLSFDLINGRLTVECDGVRCSSEAVRQAVRLTGMKAVPWEDHVSENRHAPRGWRESSRETLCAISGVCAIAGLTCHLLVQEWQVWLPLTLGLLLISTIAGVWFVLPKAWYAARTLRPDMNLLMTIAVLGAVALGDWFEAAIVSFLFSLALLLESWSVGRARRAIRVLMDLSPQRARVRQQGIEIDQSLEMPVGDVPLESIVLVSPGERIPLDGVVVKGETSVNQAPITGESSPLYKAPGDDVFAGSINNEGAIEIQTTKRAEDTSLARIIRMVEEAQARRAPVERWVEQFARYYTPAMLLAALLVASLPTVFFEVPVRQSIYNALVMLLIACPCALVISTPVTIVAGLTAAAREGVLIKGGAYLEAPARVNAVALDKTGTLTQGRPEVQQIAPLNKHSDIQVLAIAASIESLSQHPIAQAIVRHARNAGVTIQEAQTYQAIPGKGAEAMVNGRRYWIGSHRLLLEMGHDDPEATLQAERMEDDGHTVVMLGAGDHVCGLISVADSPKPHARDAIESLKHAGVRHVAMLTGDNEGTAKALAESVGVDEYHAELLPEDKVTRMRELTTRFGSAAMVGDGVNDAPAMAASALGIAMGAAGSDAAIETADITLMSDDLSKLPWLFRHSKKVLSIVKQNVALSLGLKAAVFVLTLAGWATLWLAIVADMGASLLVIFNGLRLLRDSE